MARRGVGAPRCNPVDQRPIRGMFFTESVTENPTMHRAPPAPGFQYGMMITFLASIFASGIAT